MAETIVGMRMWDYLTPLNNEELLNDAVKLVISGHQPVPPFRHVYSY